MWKCIATVTSIDDSVLPIEIIFEILLKLPVKTLLKMMCVSKSWVSLISSPQFIKTHLNLSTNNTQFAHHRILSIKNRSTTDDGTISNRSIFRTYSLYSILYEESPCLPIELHDFDNPADLSYQVLGSCDGLLCISKTSYYHMEDLFLWNPCIRELKKLPSSRTGVRNTMCTRFVYGFGYVESQNDYKVVEIVSSKSGNYRVTHVSVYSLRSNSWKRIQEYPSMSLTEPVKFVKGNLHWIDSGVSDRKATWFNPGDETFGNVALPNPSGDTCKWKLVPSAGNLCVTCDYRTKKDVWIMMEYRLAESWTKVDSIPRFVNKVVWPIFISQNDEILLQDVSGLVWWYVSRDDDTFERPENQIRCECDDRGELNIYIESQCDDRGEPNIYIESLVSPNSLENV